MVLETRARHGYCIPSEESLASYADFLLLWDWGYERAHPPNFGKKTKEGMSAESIGAASASGEWYWWLWIFLESCSPLFKIKSLQSLPLLENHLPRARGLHCGWQPAESLRGHEEIAPVESRAWACKVVSLKAHILPSFLPISPD